MKKNYIIPQTAVKNVEAHHILAASRFQSPGDSQSITTTDEEYNGEISTKGNFFGSSVWD